MSERKYRKVTGHAPAAGAVADRGTEAWRQAYAYIEAGGQFRTRRGRRRAALAYLLVTATPPLTAGELVSARAAGGFGRARPGCITPRGMRGPR